jgi:hypothetical protein
VTQAHLAAAVRSLLRSGLTILDVAELFRVHERAVLALL